MKHFLTFLICLIISTSASFAQIADQIISRALDSYIISLEHYNPGVVESAIENVMVLKSYYPKKDYSQVIQKLDELTLGHSQKTTRVKAMVAANFLKNTNELSWIDINDRKVAIKRLLDSVREIWRV